MHLLKRFLKATLGIVIALALVSLIFPAKYGSQREKIIAASADKIFPYLNDPKQWQYWSPWFDADPAMTMTFTGAATGVGAEWAWTSKTEGGGSMKYVAVEPNKRLDYTMVFESGTPARGGFILTPHDNGAATKVIWFFEGDAGYNPLARWFGLVMDKMVGPYFDRGLSKLAKQVEK